jgi:DHA1 family bicyclomycin/chloramphenicol resistance-like MFS transporter
MRTTKPPIWLLMSATVSSQMALTIFLPSLPTIARDLGVSYGTAQLTLSVYLFAFAFAQLAVGPLSDNLGRRPVLLAGHGQLIEIAASETIGEDELIGERRGPGIDRSARPPGKSGAVVIAVRRLSRMRRWATWLPPWRWRLRSPLLGGQFGLFGWRAVLVHGRRRLRGAGRGLAHPRRNRTESAPRTPAWCATISTASE